MKRLIQCVFIIYLATLGALDNWLDMGQSVSESREASISMGFAADSKINSVSVGLQNVDTPEDHEHQPCSHHGLDPCHRCHIGHCGIIVSISFSEFKSYEHRLFSSYRFSHLSPVLTGLKRPPRA